MSKHWYNNGITNGIFEYNTQPTGWVKGKLSHKIPTNTITSQNKVDEFISQITSLSEFIEYCKCHSKIEVANQYQISVTLLTNVFKRIDFKKSSEDIERTKELTMLNKYGKKRFVNIEKSKATKLEKYGNENYVNIEQVKETCLKKYGKVGYNNRDKYIQTCVEKYNVDNPFKSKDVQEKIQQTKIDKYGNSNFVNPEKARETNIERYGISCTLHTKENKEKIKETWKQKYGTQFPQQSLEVKNKIRQTRLTNNSYKTAVDTYRETCLKKYGVTNTYALAKYTNNSKVNASFANTLTENNISYVSEYIITAEDGTYYRYDFKIRNTLIEINPFATHNSTWSPFGEPLDRMYHTNKTQVATLHGFKCIHMWDWDNQDIIIKLLQPRTTIGARECEVKDLSVQETKEFLEQNHLQGYAKDNIRISLQKDNKILAVMTFGKPRYNKKYQYELIRYCATYNILGGAEKLFSYFVKHYQPTSVISYCDNSKFDGNVYSKLNFILKTNGTPTKHWYNPKTKKHITDNLLRQRGFDQLLGKEYGTFGKGTSNEELMKTHGFVEIYDVGQSTYIWTT